MRSLGPAPVIKVTTEDPETAEKFNRVLSEVAEAMDVSGIKYAFIGGVASGGMGRPRSTHDIDIFVMPEDAERTLRALDNRQFRTEKTDPSWLYKGWKENVLVDVIFKSKGEIYLDSEMIQRLTTAEFHGKRLKFVSPEDLLIIKAAAHSELTPGHWHDAIGLLSHANLDWDYLLKRARRAPRRLLSLLLYAQSNDIWVPNHVIQILYSTLFGDNFSQQRQAPTRTYPPEERLATKKKPPSEQFQKPSSTHQAYAVAHLREVLAQDPRTSELDIQIDYSNEKILLRGEVNLSERRLAVEEIVREKFPNHLIENQIRVLLCEGAGETEEMR